MIVELEFILIDSSTDICKMFEDLDKEAYYYLIDNNNWIITERGNDIVKYERYWQTHFVGISTTPIISPTHQSVNNNVN